MSLVKKFSVLSCFILIVSCTVSQRPVFNNTPPPNQVAIPSTINQPAQTRNEYYPFDLLVDTITFMDCPLNFGSLDFFAFKFSSYYEGIRLSKDFLNSVYPKTNQQINSAIRSSKYLNTKAQISFSTIGNPANFIQTGDKAFGYFLPTFSNPMFLKQMTSKRKSLNIVPNRPLETVFPMGANSLPSITNAFGSTHIFTLTYSSNLNDNPIPLKPNVYYGRTYDTFLDGGQHGKSYLADIKETSLTTGKKEGSWECPSSLRLPILRHKAITLYQYETYTKYFKTNELSPEAQCIPSKRIPKRKNAALLETVLPRNAFTLGEIHFWKDGELEGTGKSCVVPKDARRSCYANSGIIRVEFDPSEPCSFLDKDRSCPSYLSICIRK